MALVMATIFGVGTANAQNVATLGEPFQLSQTTCYTYTPTTDGVLTAELGNLALFTMDGVSADSFLYTEIRGDGSEDSPYQGIGEVQMSVLEIVNTFYVSKVSWEVKGNTPYYFFYNGDLDVTLSFAAGEIGGDEDNVITDDVPFTAYNKVMQYTAAKDGLLTIKTTTYLQFQWGPYGAGLLFEDKNHDVKIDLAAVDPDASNVTFTCPVYGGVTYYLYNDQVANCQFTFSLSDMPDPSLAYLYPEPGALPDPAGELGNGVMLSFLPLDCTIGGASITYTPNNGTETTVTLKQSETGVEGDDYAQNMDKTWKFPAVTYAFLGFTPDSQHHSSDAKTWVAAKKGTEVVLTLTGVEYNGAPVTLNETGYEDGVTVDNGTITITYVQPLEEINLVSQSWPTTIYGNSLEGEADMQVSLVFNEDIKVKPEVSFAFGRQYYGGSSGETADPGDNIPADRVSIDGATININLGGFDFASYYATGEKTYTQITFFVLNIIGADNQKYVNGSTPGIQNTLTYDNGATSGVGAIESVKADDAIYNLQGVRVANPQKGQIYIINGKKVYLR